MADLVAHRGRLRRKAHLLGRGTPPAARRPPAPTARRRPHRAGLALRPAHRGGSPSRSRSMARPPAGQAPETVRLGRGPYRRDLRLRPAAPRASQTPQIDRAGAHAPPPAPRPENRFYLPPHTADPRLQNLTDTTAGNPRGNHAAGGTARRCTRSLEWNDFMERFPGHGWPAVSPPHSGRERRCTPRPRRPTRRAPHQSAHAQKKPAAPECRGLGLSRVPSAQRPCPRTFKNRRVIRRPPACGRVFGARASALPTTD